MSTRVEFEYFAVQSSNGYDLIEVMWRGGLVVERRVMTTYPTIEEAQEAAIEEAATTRMLQAAAYANSAQAARKRRWWRRV